MGLGERAGTVLAGLLGTTVCLGLVVAISSTVNRPTVCWNFSDMLASVVAVVVSSCVLASNPLAPSADCVLPVEVSAAMPLILSSLCEIASMLFFCSAAATEISRGVLEVL